MTSPTPRHDRRDAASLLAGALALAAVAGCETVRVNYDYDPDASFERLSTFAWREHATSAGTPLESPLRDKALRDAVSAELAARGFREESGARTPQPAASAGTPRDDDGRAPAADITLSAFTVVRQRVSVSYPHSSPWGHHGWWHSPWYGQPWVFAWDEGTLVLDIADGRTGALVWRGTATRAIDDDLSPEERRARLREVVREVLTNFPPPR